MLESSIGVLEAWLVVHKECALSPQKVVQHVSIARKMYRATGGHTAQQELELLEPPIASQCLCLLFPIDARWLQRREFGATDDQVHILRGSFDDTVAMRQRNATFDLHTDAALLQHPKAVL
jgi:hypothetical protein